MTLSLEPLVKILDFVPFGKKSKLPSLKSYSILELPPEVLLLIFELLDLHSVVSLSAVSKSVHSLTSVILKRVHVLAPDSGSLADGNIPGKFRDVTTLVLASPGSNLPGAATPWYSWRFSSSDELAAFTNVRELRMGRWSFFTDWDNLDAVSNMGELREITAMLQECVSPLILPSPDVHFALVHTVDLSFLHLSQVYLIIRNCHMRFPSLVNLTIRLAQRPSLDDNPTSKSFRVFKPWKATPDTLPHLELLQVFLPSGCQTRDHLHINDLQDHLVFLQSHPRIRNLVLPKAFLPIVSAEPTGRAAILPSLFPSLRALRYVRASLETALWLSPCFVDSPIEEMYLDDASLWQKPDELAGLITVDRHNQDDTKILWTYTRVRKLTLVFYGELWGAITHREVWSTCFSRVEELTLDMRNYGKSQFDQGGRFHRDHQRHWAKSLHSTPFVHTLTVLETLGKPARVFVVERKPTKTNIRERK